MSELIDRMLHLNLRIKQLQLSCYEQDIETVDSIAEDFEDFWKILKVEQELLGHNFGEIIDEHFWELILK